MADSTELTQAWVFGHRLLPREAYTRQRRFLENLRKVGTAVLAKLWAEAATGLQDVTLHLPKTVSIVRSERIGALDFVVVQLPPPVGPGSHFIGIVFSQAEGRYVDEVESGTMVYAWRVDGQQASLRFIGAAGFAPNRPGTSTSVATGGGLGFFEDPSLETFVRAVKERHAQPSRLRSTLLDLVNRGKATSSGPRWRRELVVFALLALVVGVVYGIPTFLDDLEVRSPTSVRCAELEERRVRRKHDGHYVVLRDCEASFEGLSMRGNPLNGGVKELQLGMHAAPREDRSDPVVFAVFRLEDRYGVVSAFSRFNEAERPVRRGQEWVWKGATVAETNALTEAWAEISKEVDSGLGGVMEKGQLVVREPRGFSFGIFLMLVVGGRLALLGFAARVARRSA